MPWIRRKLRDNTVYVHVDNDGKPQAGRDGRVKIRYQPKVSAKVYRAAARNLEPTGDPEDETPIELAGADAESGASANAGASAKAGGTMPEDAIVIYTDGACTGNPGPAGIGVVLMDGEERRELSEYLGKGTNNIAELVAIERALEIVAEGDRQRPVVVHSDSSYSIGLLSKGWKAKANTELVARIRSLMSGFGDVRFVKVRGHAGVPENERCDQLARDAITNR